MVKAKKAEKEKKAKPEKVEASVLAAKAGKPEKVKKQKPESHGISAVDLVTVFPDEPASCSFEAVTGRLTLRVPQPLDGAPGPEGPQGKAGKGLDYSKAPGGKDQFFLFVDEAGRLAYSARGAVSLVNVSPVEKAAHGDDEVD